MTTLETTIGGCGGAGLWPSSGGGGVVAIKNQVFALILAIAFRVRAGVCT